MKIEIEIPDDLDVADVYWRVLDGHVKNPPEYLEWEELEEAWRVYYDAVRSSDTLNMLSYFHEMVLTEFSSGIRCSVCGMTSDQAKAANYDCAMEC